MSKDVSIRAGEPAIVKGKRGPAKGQGGRPASPDSKVELRVWVRPETLAALRIMGSPGPAIDSIMIERRNNDLRIPAKPALSRIIS